MSYLTATNRIAQHCAAMSAEFLFLL